MHASPNKRFERDAPPARDSMVTAPPFIAVMSYGLIARKGYRGLAAKVLA
jgi:hypothetical protein